MQAYSDPRRASDPFALPNVEVFYISEDAAESQRELGEEDANLTESGYYWWPCFPGCMPDSDAAYGPFQAAEEALADAQDDCDDCE